VLKTTTIREAFAADHDHLETLLGQFQHDKRSDFAQAREAFKAFKQGLQRHIMWEEQILFPLFEQKTGMYSSGPTEVMRHEHRLIGEQLENIHDKVREADPDSDAAEQRLVELLSAHNQKEEMALYPALDRLLSEAEKESAFERMQSLPEEAYRSCCGHHGAAR
jgi:hemerythrin-like domain-containing protein